MASLTALLHIGLILFILLFCHELLQFGIVGLHRLGHLLAMLLHLAVILWWFRALALHLLWWHWWATSSWMSVMMWPTWSHLVSILCIKLQHS